MQNLVMVDKALQRVSCFQKDREKAREQGFKCI